MFRRLDMASSQAIVRHRSTIFVALPPSAALASGYVVAEPSASRFGGTIGGSRRSAFPAMCSHGHQMLMTMPPLVSFTHDEAVGS